MKELTAQSERNYSSVIKVHYSKGYNVIKIIGEDYSESFKISQQNAWLKYEGNVKEMYWERSRG